MAITGVRDRTILGPLTTTFTPPATCSSIFGDCSTCLQGWRAQVCLETKQIENTDCWPPTSAGAQSATQPLQGWGFYSPGIVCPAGHYSACSATAGSTSGWEVQFSMLPGETAVGCCPEGYSCTADLANGIAQTCIQYNTMGTLSTLSCNGASTITGSTVLSNYDSFTGYAPLIQINFRDVDIGKTSATQTVSGSNLGSARASAKATGTGAATNTDSPIIVAEGATSGSSNNGLSTSAVIGIAVAVSLGVLLTALIAGCLLLRRRRRQPGGAMGPQELDGSSMNVGGIASNDSSPVSAVSSHAMGGAKMLEMSMPPSAYQAKTPEAGYNSYRGAYEPSAKLVSAPAMEPVEMEGSLPPYVHNGNMAELAVEPRSAV
ncbi:hypothetical protein CFIMG_004486RA [Ceratocystis fimbriata CBS 114723]|uniref:Uncharacterized protein n=1 Tax=Ceratocystis fimbriata CBS 114723 TaxID=1035309 RepID=A0A2C5X113_9PEZI|nr:hypothetical protein CFIMG_004486RA [Ceratocystis fimbriata CBS 114723]